MPRLALPRRLTVLSLCVGFAVFGVAPSASWAAGTAVQTTWHGQQARIYPAQAAGSGGAGVLVAVLDGWIDRSHKDFGGRAATGVSCVGGTCTAGQQADGCWHGTHVAGLVASSSFGVAPRARILPVQVLTGDASGACTGSPADVSAGIHYAVDAGARILNLSLGADLPGESTGSAIPAAIQYAVSKDVLVVFSAGNSDAPMADTYGGGALIVAATGPSGQLANYSQHGQGISLAAPGGQGAGTDKDGKPICLGQSDCVTSLLSGGKYGVAAGTSMAAPQVSGTAALLLGQNPARTRDQLAQRLTATARPLAQAGAGLLDASAALGVANSAPSETTSGGTTSGGTAPGGTASPTASSRPVVRPEPSAFHGTPSVRPLTLGIPPAVPVKPSQAPTTPGASTQPASPTPAPSPSQESALRPPAAATALVDRSRSTGLSQPVIGFAVGLLALVGAGAGAVLTSRLLRRHR